MHSRILLFFLNNDLNKMNKMPQIKPELDVKEIQGHFPLQGFPILRFTAVYDKIFPVVHDHMNKHRVIT